MIGIPEDLDKEFERHRADMTEEEFVKELEGMYEKLDPTMKMAFKTIVGQSISLLRQITKRFTDDEEKELSRMAFKVGKQVIDSDLTTLEKIYVIEKIRYAMIIASMVKDD